MTQESIDRLPRALCAFRHNRPASFRRQAFTLIEIMLAITIFGLVLISIYSSWTAILRATRAGLTGAAEAQRTRMTLRSVREALSSAILYSGSLEHYAFLSDTSGDFAALSLVAQLPASFPGSGLFGAHTIRRVAFSVETGPSSQNQLVLRQSPLLEPADAQPYKIVLAPHVRRFTLEFLDTNKFEWLPEWTLTNQLPKIVRVGLSFGKPPQGPGAHDDVVYETILVSSFAIPRELQVPPLRRGVGVPPGGIRPGPGPINPGNPGQVLPPPAAPGPGPSFNPNRNRRL
jgi:prepilin-type N-terminal cleavage/methylation domain-containing protein